MGVQIFESLLYMVKLKWVSQEILVLIALASSLGQDIWTSLHISQSHMSLLLENTLLM